MNNFKKQYLNTSVIIIGSPATGKSTTTAKIAEMLDTKVIDSDVEFRKYRSDADHPSTIAFYNWITDNKVMVLNKDDNSLSPVDLSITSDSKKCRGTTFVKVDENGNIAQIPAKEGFQGEEVFRTNEYFVIKHILQTGMAKGNMLVTSSTAPTRSDDVNLLRSFGYNFILLSPNVNDVYRNLYKDWQSYRENGKTLRGAYELAADRAYNMSKENGECEECAKLSGLRALTNMWDDVNTRRMPIFSRLVNDGGLIINPKENASISDIAALCLSAITQLSSPKPKTAKAFDISKQNER